MSQPDATTAPATSDFATAAGLRNRILSRPAKLGERVVHVPQWDTDVLVIELTALRRAELLQHAAADGQVQLKRIYPDMVIASAHHPGTRERLFDDADREALLADSGAAIETIATVAGQLSGMDENAGKSAEGN